MLTQKANWGNQIHPEQDLEKLEEIMNTLDIAIIIFIIMETANVCILYFAPDSKLGNGVAVFKPWETAKKEPNAQLFAQYMTNWVAGTKLIFIVLLVVVLLTGSETTKIYAVGAMILSIGTYFWRLHPIVQKLDSLNQISPKGYSRTLGFMIAGFLAMFSIALLGHLIIR
ncbi:MAG: hypothetical protein ACRC6X_02190 [Culicoidibacterales bacterium]